MKTTKLDTPLGLAIIEGDERGITRISIGDQKDSASSGSPVSGGTAFEELEAATVPTELQEAVLQLREYFHGTRTHFSFKMAPEGTYFQRKVWKQLLNIPFGTTVSYLNLAQDLGDVKAIRAVASANGRNPLWIAVPCHRVIGSDGSLTGYAGGLWRKKWLLEHENPPKQTSLFQALE